MDSAFVASAPAGRRVARSFLGRHIRSTYPDPPTSPAPRKTPWLGRLEKRPSLFRPFTLHAVGTVGSTPHARAAAALRHRPCLRPDGSSAARFLAGSVAYSHRLQRSDGEPPHLFATEPMTCQYEWTFPSTAACGPGQHPSGPASAAALAARNFGCGHISCGWMFLIIIPLVSILAFAIMVPVNKFVLKKGGTWKDAIPLTVLPCLLFDFVKWGILFAIFNWPCCAQKWEFKRFNCAKAGGGFSSSDHGDADDGASGYQAGDDIDSAIEHDDI